MIRARPAVQWPLILCGPMLRRVTTREVCVFIAFRQPARVRLRLFEAGAAVAVGPEPPLISTRALGERLHVALAFVRSDGLFLSPGFRYRYDLEITRLRGDVPRTDTLATLDDTPLPLGDGYDSDGPNLLQGDCPLGGAPGDLPSFAVPLDRNDLTILHASCRKPHGEGPDMLALADAVRIEAPFQSVRPRQLLLTGDQIYADDVALGLAQVIADTAPRLLLARFGEDAGTDTSGGAGVAPDPRPGETGTGPDDYHGELPPGDAAQGGDPAGHPMRDEALQPGQRRADFVRDVARLSIDNEIAGGHLLYLAEFYAMYLLAWSPALWPVDASGEVQVAAVEAPLSADPDEARTLRIGTSDDTPRLKAFHRRLPEVRRALANLPTFMIFDDHEISDDWNLTRHWVDRVRGSRAGRQVVRNGLLAYAVFQDWGNRRPALAADPDAPYAPGSPGATLLDAVTCPPDPADPLKATAALPPILTVGGLDVRHAVEDLLGLRPHLPPGPPTMAWHYHVVFPDSHLLVALDNRTRRLLPDDSGPAGLNHPEHLAQQLDLPHAAGADLQAIVMAPVPVFDLPPTEHLKDGVSKAYRVVVGPMGGDGLYEFLDRETWSGNRQALRALVEHLVPFGRVVLLSGDIHYAFTNDITATAADGQKARIVQLCASAARNEDDKTRAAVPTMALPLAVFDTYEMTLGGDPGLVEALADGIGQSLDNVRAMGSAGLSLAGDLTASLLRLDIARTMDVAAAVPLAKWLGQAGCEPLDSLPPTTGVTHCTVRHIRAAPGPDGGTIHPSEAPWAPTTEGQPVDGVLLSDFSQAVGVNNIGLLRFDEPDAAHHTLFWYSRNFKGERVRLWETHHVVPLTPPVAD
ncbi:MAG: hypothetical protein KDH20_08495 [Rhodocyclaceae bacterium]|nr:hypothetical protein [Rhodocyclaceae bacterium]